MQTHTVMIQGTGSNVGKSTLVTGLCRLLLRRGLSVAPFKPQNMALNSAVTIDGGEIGRAQALQAQAAGLEPHSDMNPVLLKPNSEMGSQVIINGKVLANMSFMEYHRYKPQAMKQVLAAHERLRKGYNYVLVEGAGSPAEINLRENDIANMGFAEAVDCPVILVADIDRGGVFAQIVGTLALLDESEKARIQGFIINNFRGNKNLLRSGLEWLEQYTGKPVFGVVPYLKDLQLDGEDSMNLQEQGAASKGRGRQKRLRVLVPAFSRISNYTDFNPLRAHPDVELYFVGPGARIPEADLIILPGSKNTQTDLAWLRKNGWEQAIHKHLRYGGKIIGICGGFQMLGKRLLDPHGIEGRGEVAGLGLLEMETTLANEKRLTRVNEARLTLDGEAVPVNGYEIHMGRSQGPALQQPVIQLENSVDGALSADGRILGTYLHGLFDHGQACRQLLRWAGLQTQQQTDQNQIRENNIDRIADHLAQHLDLDSLYAILTPKHGKQRALA